MPYQVHIIEEKEIVKVFHEDFLTHDDLCLIRCGAAFLSSLRGWDKVLLNLKNADVRMQAAEFATLFRKLDEDMPNGAFVAIVEPRECDFDYCRLAKSIVNSWTASKVDVFENEMPAISWLCACGK